MTLVLAACALLLVSGVAGAAFSARRGLGLTVAAAGTVPAAICGSWAALHVLRSGRTEAIEVAGSLPGSRLALALDPLSAAAARTWGCGYAGPSSSMQYTAASFASPLVRVFAPVLVPIRQLRSASVAFPALVECSDHASDLAQRYGLEPSFLWWKVAR